MKPVELSILNHNKMYQDVDFKTHWTGEFWGDRIEKCQTIMIPHMLNLLKDPELSHCWTNFLIAAGLEEGEHGGPPFHDGDFYKWLESASAILGQFPDYELEEEIDSIIGIIKSVQQPDGYIFTQYSIEKRNNPNTEPLSDDLNFEVYNLGHLISASCVHYRATNKRVLLDVGIKAASYLERTFKNRDKSSARTAICPSHYMGLADLYRVTGDKKWLNLLSRLIEMRDQVTNGTDDNQDRIPLKSQREIIGHAVRANYLYAGVTDLYLESGKDDYLPVLEAIWNDLVSKKMYITGSCGALYDGVSPYGCEDYFYIQRTHQSYGRAYELPNTAGYNETCAAIGNYLWNGRMMLAFGDSRFADLMERILYNGTLSGISLDGKKYFYTNALRNIEENPFSFKWSRHREPYITSFCCPPNLLRTIAETASWICCQREEGLAIIFYGSSRIEKNHWGEGAVIGMNSRFPWDGEIDFTMEEPGKKQSYPLFFRIPEWTDSYKIEYKGDPVDDITETQGFIRFERSWQKGDKIKLSFSMPVKMLESHHMVEENRNHIAVMRGPLVYCLESYDLPQDTDLSDVYVKANFPWKSQEFEINGFPIIALEGRGYVKMKQSQKDNTELYRTLGNDTFEEISLKLIPYFTWDNRGCYDMSVWLPLKPA